MSVQFHLLGWQQKGANIAKATGQICRPESALRRCHQKEALRQFLCIVCQEAFGALSPNGQALLDLFPDCGPLASLKFSEMHHWDGGACWPRMPGSTKQHGPSMELHLDAGTKNKAGWVCDTSDPIAHLKPLPPS